MIAKVAFVSMHTSPLRDPGEGDAGGMNVYLQELAATMAARGVEVDVYTRRDQPGSPDTVEVTPGYRVHHLAAGPVAPLSIEEQVPHLAEFSRALVERLEARSVRPDLVHSHYWLSGWAALEAKRRFDIPMANSFHTLGRVKDATRREDQSPTDPVRIAAEENLISSANCVVASTPFEADDLMDHYGADPTKLCVSPPGVNRTHFRPGSRSQARSRLGLGDEPLALFVGRIQSLKAPDVALEAVAMATDRLEDLRLLIVGGPSGPQGEREMQALQAAAAGLAPGAVRFHPPVGHSRLADFYRAADVLVAPSRSESFGLVAAEAQACGLPVVAARRGGLMYVVEDGGTGLLVEGWEPQGYAAAICKVIEDPELRSLMSARAVKWAGQYSWQATSERLLELYRSVLFQR
ncbi:MAG: glycosyltransferase [bacterium]|nr:glycosyltransferase [bacterium]